MPLKLPNFFSSRGYLTNINSYLVSVGDLATARAALKSDIDCFFLNGLISLASAFTSLRRNGYSWAFVKAYYTVFYLARAFNGINDYAIVYSNKKPYGIKIQPGQRFQKLSGNSHDVVLNQFRTHLSSDVLLANTIEGISPVEWFNNRRNEINYTFNPQTDPIPPFNLYSHKAELRKWLATYLADKTHLYTFDPSHCYMAYPLQLFLKIYDYYISNNLKLEFLTSEAFDFFSLNFSDDKGPITFIISRIQDLSN